MKRAIALLAILMLAVYGFTVAAQASEDVKCTETKIIKPAWTETINHPAETHTETIPGKPSQWWNWSPNHNQRPFEGPPAFPNDERGTWEGPHTEGSPSQDQFGTFQQGNGNGSWFHREASTQDRVIVVEDKPAWTQTVNHPAITEEVEVPCEPEPCPDDSLDPETCEPSPPLVTSTPCPGKVVVGQRPVLARCVTPSESPKPSAGTPTPSVKPRPSKAPSKASESPSTPAVVTTTTPPSNSTVANRLPNTGAGDFLAGILAGLLLVGGGIALIRRGLDRTE